MEVPDHLKQEIIAGRCVAFVGAGFSAAAKLPTWEQLLRRMASEKGLDNDVVRYVNSALNDVNKSGRFEEAAQILYHALGRKEFIARLRHHMAVKSMPDEMTRRLEWLDSIPFKFVLTTNFDDVLAGQIAEPKSFAKMLRTQPQNEGGRFIIPGFPARDLRDDGSRTVKLHGDLSQPDGVVFSRLDYRSRLYKDSAYMSFLRSVFLNHTVLYLGFSFADAYINELRSEALAMLGSDSPEPPLAYAVMPNVPCVGQEYLRTSEGIQVLSFESSGDDFSGFDTILRDISLATSPVARFGTLSKGKGILWLGNRDGSVTYLRDFFNDAVAVHAQTPPILDFADTYTEALEKLKTQDYDLAISRWGHGEGTRDDASMAVSLLQGIRKNDIKVPVIIFASGDHIKENKPIALKLGAQGYFYSWRGLIDAIERVFDPGLETG